MCYLGRRSVRSTVSSPASTILLLLQYQLAVLAGREGSKAWEPVLVTHLVVVGGRQRPLCDFAPFSGWMTSRDQVRW